MSYACHGRCHTAVLGCELTFLHLLHDCIHNRGVAMTGINGTEHGDEVDVCFPVDVLYSQLLGTLSPMLVRLPYP